MTYGKYMNDFTDICTKVWSCDDLKDKRNLLKRAITSFKYKEKQEEFLNYIANASADDCDRIASNLILNKTDKVIK